MLDYSQKESIYGELESLVTKANYLNPAKRGCVVIILDINTGHLVFHKEVSKLVHGSGPFIKYWYHATEKAMRLLENIKNGHTTSAESADMITNFPGAVLCGNYIVSVSGQDMWLDEAIATHFGRRMNWVDAEVVGRVVKTKNSRYSDLEAP